MPSAEIHRSPSYLARQSRTKIARESSSKLGKTLNVQVASCMLLFSGSKSEGIDK
jgi:hypothetical protein